jgi:O-glycosyl hydrolase
VSSVIDGSIFSFVRVIWWDEWTDTARLADNVVLDEEGYLNLTALAKKWNLKRVAVGTYSLARAYID